MRGVLVVAFLLTSLQAYGVEAGPIAPASIAAIDATPAFWKFWDAAEGKPDIERVQLFNDIVVAAHPELFGSDVLNKAALAGISSNEHAASIASAYLRAVVPYIPRMRSISQSIRDSFDTYASEFKATFPDFAPKSPVYFTVSLFSFDGATRSVGGKTALLFGIDGIARYHGEGESLKVLFDHELFHQYHEQIIPDDGDDNTPLWMSLWEEGLATFVSQQMNSGSTEAQIFMSDKLADLTKPMLPALARELLENFDSLDRNEYAAFFYSANGRPDIPGRCGYVVGYRIAQYLSAGRSLQRLALLKGPELKAAVKQALEKMADQS
jgi:hypothetical protein